MVEWMDCSVGCGRHFRVWADIDNDATFVHGEIVQGQGHFGSWNHINGDTTSDVDTWEAATGLSWASIKELFEMGADHDRRLELYLPPISLLTRTQ